MRPCLTQPSFQHVYKRPALFLPDTQTLVAAAPSVRALSELTVQNLDTANFAPIVVETTTKAAAPVPLVSFTEPSSIEISFGTATVHVRGAADPRTLALVLKALKVLA